MLNMCNNTTHDCVGKDTMISGKFDLSNLNAKLCSQNTPVWFGSIAKAFISDTPVYLW